MTMSKSKDKENNGTSINHLIIFKQLLSSLSDIVDQLELDITEKGITIQVMDSMHVCLVDSFLSSSLFSHFRCDKNVKIGIPLKLFNAIIKHASLVHEDESFRLSCKDDLPEFLDISFGPNHRITNTKLLLHKFTSDSSDTPTVEYKSDVYIPSTEFRNIYKGLTFAEHVSFTIVKDELIIGQSSDTLTTKINLVNNVDGNNNKEDDGITVNCIDCVKVEIHKKYLDMIHKIIGCTEGLKVEFFEDSAPLFFSMDLYGMGNFKMFVAPQSK